MKSTPIYRGYVKTRVLHKHGLYRHPTVAASYLLFDPEIDNFTYDIANRDELAEFVARMADIRLSDAEGFIAEADALTTPIPLGRRIGWYAFVRAFQPLIVFETGTHDGLGAFTIGHALTRNGQGRLFTFDINADTGRLIPPELPVDRVVGDTLRTLPETIGRVGRPDLFLHDSLHTYAHEAAEFAAVYKPGMVLLSDNAHATTALADFAATRDLEFAYLQEKPLNHWYPGAGIGFAH